MNIQKPGGPHVLIHKDQLEGLTEELRRLVAQRDAVLVLHHPGPGVINKETVYCQRCLGEWPCATVRCLGVTE